jgi:hypothetical protein
MQPQGWLAGCLMHVAAWHSAHSCCCLAAPAPEDSVMHITLTKLQPVSSGGR